MAALLIGLALYFLSIAPPLGAAMVAAYAAALIAPMAGLSRLTERGLTARAAALWAGLTARENPAG